MTALLVVLGAAVGAPLRYVVDRAVRARHDSMFPWGTLLVNVAGSALLGFLVALPVGPGWSALLGSGFCGALTTYSTLGHETVRLAEQGAGRHAVASAAANVALGLAAASGGMLAAGALA
ncbi:fluoride efflux transporter FluC [Nonomuraea sp. CA-218870]|uniref:fluoride efflux transporter FluC n=1 Tax=Nonomuraea sp. CA-218870 TaxID=3239998 RepID=UPI003D90F690